MYQGRTHRHSIFCILPAYILNSIAQNGTSQQRTQALRTLGIDHTFRALRTTHDLMATVQTRGPALLAAEGRHQRTISDAHHTTNLPGDVVRVEGAASTGDPFVDEAYEGLGATYSFYWEAYHRNSIDDEAGLLKSRGPKPGPHVGERRSVGVGERR